MLIATFGPSTGWAGKTITYKAGVYTLQDHGPITAADVMAYDAQGHLVWANEQAKEMVSRDLTQQDAGEKIPKEPKKRGSRRRKALIATGAIFVVFVVLAVIGAMLPETDQKQEPKASEQVPVAETSEPAAETEPTATPTPAAKSVKAILEESLSAIDDDLKSVSWRSANGRVRVVYDWTDKAVWNENSFVRQAAEQTADVLASAFRLRKVQSVSAVYQMGMTDQYGTTETEDVLTVSWTREEWANVKDIQGFKDQMTLRPENILRGAESYYVHPGIYKNTDLSEKDVPAFSLP